MNNHTVAISTYMMGKSSGGPETYDKCIIPALIDDAGNRMPHVNLFALVAYPGAIDLLPERYRNHCRITKPVGKLGVLASSQRLVRRLDAGVVHATYVLPPISKKTRIVATVHDIGFIRNPDFFPKAIQWRLEKNLQYMVKRADIIVTVSEATRTDLLDITNLNPSKVVTVHNGIDPLFSKPKSMLDNQAVLDLYGVKKPFILYAGRLQPRKNVIKLVEAYELLRQSNRFEHQLVLLGEPRAFLWEKPQARIHASPYRKDIIQTGHIPWEHLPGFYDEASVFSFVSRYEGFGFPVLEAMSRGLPVVCSNTTSLPEVAGDAAVLVSPLDSEEIADGLCTVLSDDSLQKQMIQKGFEQASHFSWDRAARSLNDIYRRLL